MNRVETILKALGDRDNITALEAYITHVRVEVKNDEAIDEKSLHDAGAFGVVAADRSIQVVMRSKTEAIVDAIETLR